MALKNGSAIRRIITVIPFVVFIAGCTRIGVGANDIKHVVVISLDTTRADHFGFLGNPRVKTPRLDALAAESVVFTDYMSAAPTTLASHVTLFTGMYPHHHGTPRNGFMVNGDNIMLAEILRDAGFHTAGFVGSFAMESRFDVAQGFDHYDENFSMLIGELDYLDQDQRRAAGVTDAVIEYLDASGVPERLFLFVHYFDPHRPYSPPAPFDTMYDPEGSANLPSITSVALSDSLSGDEKRYYARRHEMAYAGEISYMDHHVGRLIDDLRNREVLENALVVVTSDHGENFREHYAYYNHGYTVYQTTLRAVWMCRLPGARNGGERVDQLTASVDVLPTILDLLELKSPVGLDGQGVDLARIHREMRPRTRFGEATKPWEDVEDDPRWTNIRKARCVRQGRYKFIATPYRGTEELYDIEADPAERWNLLDLPSAETKDVARRLREELRIWTDAANPLKSGFESSQQEETLKRLKSLGYITN